MVLTKIILIDLESTEKAMLKLTVYAQHGGYFYYEDIPIDTTKVDEH